MSKVNKPIIISGFPGVGKSYLTTKTNYRVSDSDSSKFPKEGFPGNYILHIKDLIRKNELDFILVSSHKVVRDALVEANIPFVLVYPDKSLKEAYIKRYIKRGSNAEFVKLISDNWDSWIDECNEFAGKKYVLKNKEDTLMSELENISNSVN